MNTPVTTGDAADLRRPNPRLLFLWSGASGYMAACWRAMTRRAATCPKTPLPHVIAREPSKSLPFDKTVLADISHTWLTPEQWADVSVVEDVVNGLDASVLVVAGWANPALNQVIKHKLADLPCVMTMDNPWLGTLRQRLGTIRMRRWVGNFTRVVVPGERAFQFACRLGVPPRRIRRGLYGLDVAGLSVAAEQRPDPWPRRFLFLGRYSHEKDPQTLVKAYQLYRQRFGDASWSLHTHGTGPLATVFEGQAGIVNGGFQQPDKLPGSLAQAGAMVLPSRFEPWGVAIAEACAAGLPVVVSEACGASVELVRPHYNGLTFEAGDAAGLARALERIHRLGDAGELATWGRRSRQIVDPFAADRWVDRWTALTHEALDAPDTSAS